MVLHIGPTLPKKFRIWDSISLNTSELRNINIPPHQQTEALVTSNRFNTKNLKVLYDEEILQADHKIGLFLKKLKERNIYKDSLIIITSDHGQSFGEHGNWGHHHLPFEEEIHIPLVIKFPKNKWAGRRVKQPVGLINIVPTIYDYLDLSSQKNLEPSLLPVIKRKETNLSVYSSANPNEDWMVRSGIYKYFLFSPSKMQNTDLEDVCMKNKTPEGEKLYNLRTDPNESNNIANVKPSITRDLQRRLCKIYLKGLEKEYQNKVNLSRKEKGRLKELGYLRG